jgi:hypothetical protein
MQVDSNDMCLQVLLPGGNSSGGQCMQGLLL